MNDQRKTKKQFIEELDAERQKRAGVDLPGLGRQLAVEQMRAAAMDMRATSDLRIVVAVLFRHMRALGIDTPAASIHFVHEEAATVTGYYAEVDPRTLGFARDDDPAQDRFVVVEDTVASGGQRSWTSQERPGIVDPWRSGQTRTHSPSAEETVLVDQFVNVYGMEMQDAQGFADQVWQGDWQVTNVPFRFGVIGYREREHHPAHDDIVAELARGLELGFLRFLDFQKVEAQNRELTIQNAPERVRARALGMQEGEDIGDVVWDLFEESRALGFPIYRPAFAHECQSAGKPATCRDHPGPNLCFWGWPSPGKPWSCWGAKSLSQVLSAKAPPSPSCLPVEGHRDSRIAA